MKNLILLFTCFLAVESKAAIQRYFRDGKFPTQKMIEYQLFENVSIASDTNILNAHAGPTSASATTVTSFVAQPDLARTLWLTPNGSGGDIGAACSITVNGTNHFSESISETWAFTENSSSSRAGTYAFLTVSSVVFAANCEDGAFGTTWSLGYGDKLGIKRCMDQSGHFLFSTLAGSKEGTAPTLVVDANEVEKNTVDFAGTFTGSNDFELFFFQNYGCVPTP